MAKLTIYLLAIIVLMCQSISVLSKQVDFNDYDFGGNGGDQQPPQQAQAGTTTTLAPPNFTRCFDACNTRVTTQYSPVCGSNGQSYNNLKRLECAQQCGLRITVSHIGTCGPSAGGK